MASLERTAKITDSSSEISSTGARRTDRIHISIPVEAIGTDFHRGRPFCQKGRTLIVSRHGAAVVLNFALATDQELTIRCLNTRKEAEARVVGLISGPGNDLVYGLAFLNAEANPWDIEFPSLMGDEGFGRILLQCRVCQAYRVVHLNEIEIQVFEANESIQQFCKSCSTTTSWKRAANEARREPLQPDDKQTQESMIRRFSAINKRKENRVRTSVAACIREPGFPEEIVTCENISRGGLRFRASKLYGKGTVIEVAVPYSAGNGNIFVSARIVYVQDCGSSFRLGAVYLGASGKQQRTGGYDRSSRLPDTSNP